MYTATAGTVPPLHTLGRSVLHVCAQARLASRCQHPVPRHDRTNYSLHNPLVQRAASCLDPASPRRTAICTPTRTRRPRPSIWPSAAHLTASAVSRPLRGMATTTQVNGVHAASNGIKIDPDSNTVSTPNAWSVPGPAAFDLRSDVVTTPTASMLAAVVNTTLLDDVFAEDTTTNALQARIAELTGKEAALLVTSGTMGNQLALRAVLPVPPAGFLADARTHLLSAEAGGVSWISGAFVQPVTPSNGHHLTLSDVQKHAIVDTDVHGCPTRVIGLENTLAGTVFPLCDAQEISAWARAQSPPIAMHLDGARLWDAVSSGAGTLREYCAAFDTVNLCFSKGLGAPVGSILAGPADVIARARHIRKAFGGGLRQAGLIAGPARVALEETFLGGVLGQSHARARQIAAAWQSRGGCLALPVETNMVWCDLAAHGLSKDAFVQALAAQGLKAIGGRLVVHYQIGEEAVRRFERAAEQLLSTS